MSFAPREWALNLMRTIVCLNEKKSPSAGGLLRAADPSPVLTEAHKQRELGNQPDILEEGDSLGLLRLGFRKFVVLFSNFLK